MHTLLTIDQILERASRIGLKKQDLCRGAGVSPQVIHRIVRLKRARTETLRRLGEELIRQERDRYRELRALHPEALAQEQAA